MRTRPFGPLDRSLPVIGLGTWQLERDDRAAAIAAIHRGVELGMTHVDTAEMYGSGHVEELLGEALAGRRDQVFLASKVLPEHGSRAGVIAACEASLRRLRTDHLDLYLLHWRGEHPLADTVAGFEALVAAGKIAAWGVSNFAADDLDELRAVADAGRITCNQVLYHLGERTIEHAVIPWCERHGVAVVAYSPLGAGDFPSPRSAGGRALAEVAAAYGATAYQVALAFLVRTPAVFAIPKAARRAHVEDDAGAGELELSAADVARLDAAFPRGRWRGLPTL
ncbi:MAG: aldo/keto reductase [Kofleriaceae bacterium]|nr:aldo/keto reductase [Myxococcales bacterium]MCB9563996.1 aldo/keto reductase [Kofleriaceae bacterium]